MFSQVPTVLAIQTLAVVHFIRSQHSDKQTPWQMALCQRPCALQAKAAHRLLKHANPRRLPSLHQDTPQGGEIPSLESA